MVELSSASGCPLFIHWPNADCHSSSDKHQAGLLAMIWPLHNGKPEASSASFTARANGRKAARRVAASSFEAAAKIRPLS